VNLARSSLAIGLTAIFASVATLAGAGWDGFFAFPAPAPSAAVVAAPQVTAPVSVQNVCVQEILRAQTRYSIPDNILLGIGLQEAGFVHEGQLTIWPWAVNAEGTGRIFDTRAKALGWVEEQQGTGVRSIDVGCMQINLRWHPEAFTSTLQGFNPAVNVDYAARFLLRLYQKTNDWMLAAGSYHSFNPETRDVYMTSLRRNVAVANARIDTFRAMVSGDAEIIAAAEAAPQPAPAPPQEQEPDPNAGVIWSSWLSLRGGSEHRRGIYSAKDLQPALPNFVKQF